MGMREELADEFGDDLLFADGFDDAIIGVAHSFNASVVLYDYDKCVDILIAEGCQSKEDADEYMAYNVIGAYVGNKTPAFAELRMKTIEGHK